MGPTSPATAGASAIQLNTRRRPASLLASRLALRWIAIIPKPEPAPLSAAAAQSVNRLCDAAASSVPTRAQQAAMRTGRW